jgi:hypothetical protein
MLHSMEHPCRSVPTSSIGLHILDSAQKDAYILGLTVANGTLVEEKSLSKQIVSWSLDMRATGDIPQSRAARPASHSLRSTDRLQKSD